MTDNVTANELRQLIERVERLSEEMTGIRDDIKDVYSEAKARGFDVKAMRRLVKLRKIESNKRQEQSAIVETYAAALGIEDTAA